jgi:two-component system OmpR family response regulator
MQTIAIVDDDPEIRDLLDRHLTESGFRTMLAADGDELQRRLDAGRPDLIVLDLMLPGRNGFTLCRELREAGQSVPIVMLTARDAEIDRVVGLELGADDYVTKPFSGRELVARIRAVLRRVAGGEEHRADVREYRFANWRFRPAEMELIDEQDVAVPLSSSESALLLAFVRQPRTPLSRDELLDITKGRTAYPFDRSIDTQVSRLRRKLGGSERHAQIIKTVWGRGYMFAAEPEAL